MSHGHLHPRVPRAAALAVLVLLACSLLAPASAPAAGNIEGGNSFSELSQKAQQQEETTTKAKTTNAGTEGETHNSSKLILIGLGVAAVLLVGIAFVIMRDARRVAPATAGELAEGKRGHDPAARRRNRRAKAKAARAQRKKNR